ncbi:hypothetical protein AVEN_76032-1 [Araneus ventricosus]|uniref:GOLD domain-containing protein n=1 Tax=Araneus ventricosus TaxID=182803 RepID=A0A4Y2WUS3_ARAVE|nr:hypothetical protein AVEN_76032-1 [Araneus ventricosus]
MSRGCKKLTLASDAEKLTVKPFSKEEIHFEVMEENSYLEWEFEMKNKDIDFSLLFRRESSEYFEPIEIIPKQRIDANDEPQKGCFKCEKAGIYTMIFDNTYSWIYSKEVYYRAEIKGLRNDEIYSFT